MLLAALSEHDLSSAARFGLETAMLNLWADVEGTAWHGQLGRTPRGTVSVNALLDGDDLACSAEACLDQGYRSIKIKVGVHAPEQDAERVALLSALINGRAGLRLDANGAWDIDEALRFASALGDHEIDYIEEPLRNHAELARFVDETDLPVALDESLPESAGSGITVKAWVIKPTIQGGISGALKLCAGARERGATPVISACFESGVGMRALAQLAACVGDEGVPVGLDTGKWLDGDVIDPTVEIENGCIDVDSLVAFAPRLLIG
jgi:o-succinylbenzoate synthase